MAAMHEILAGFDQAKLLELRHRLGVPDDDPIYLYLAGLEYYRQIFDELPERLKATRDDEVRLAAQRLQVEADRMLLDLKAGIHKAAREAIKAEAGAAIGDLHAAVTRLKAVNNQRSKTLYWFSLALIAVSSCAFALRNH